MVWALLLLALAPWQLIGAQNVVLDGEVGLVSGALPDGAGAPLPPPATPAEIARVPASPVCFQSMLCA